MTPNFQKFKKKNMCIKMKFPSPLQALMKSKGAVL